MKTIVPALLEHDADLLSQRLRLAKTFATSIQVDICDGQYVLSKTWPYSIDRTPQDMIVSSQSVEGIRQDFEGLWVEFDLMIQNPEQTLVYWLMMNPRRIVIHPGSTSDLSRCLAVLHGYQLEHPKFQYGIAIGTSEDISACKKTIKSVDFVQCMGIAEIGAQGQSFDPRVFDQIAAVRALDPEIEISVDGAVGAETISQLLASGADRLVCGSSIWGSGNAAENYIRMNDLIS